MDFSIWKMTSKVIRQSIALGVAYGAAKLTGYLGIEVDQVAVVAFMFAIVEGLRNTLKVKYKVAWL